MHILKCVSYISWKSISIFVIGVILMLTTGSESALAFGGSKDWMEDGGCGNAGSLGFAICNLVISISKLPVMLSGISYLFGISLGLFALIKLKDHVDNPGQVALWEPFKRFIAGSMFLALPTIVEVIKNSLNWGVARGDVTGFNVGEVGGAGLDALLVALVDDLWYPMQYLIGAFAWIAGLMFIMVGISRMLKSADEGARGPSGIGTIMTFLTGAALLTADSMMSAVSGSIFLSNNYATYGILQTTAGLTSDQEQHINSVIGAIVGFMVIVGWVSFIRGFFIVRDFSEGGQSSIMAGITHIIGGALAVNIGSVLNAIQFTLGLETFGIIFS